MTRAEVKSILGTPGDYVSVVTNDDNHKTTVEWLLSDNDPRLAVWVGRHGCIVVEYTSSDPPTVAEVSFGEPNWAVRGTIAKLILQAKRQWHRWFPE
jgi:hypothetical protein